MSKDQKIDGLLILALSPVVSTASFFLKWDIIGCIFAAICLFVFYVMVQEL